MDALEIIWPFNSVDAQINFWIFFLSMSGLSFLTFRLSWTLKALLGGDESENDDAKAELENLSFRSLSVSQVIA